MLSAVEAVEDTKDMDLLVVDGFRVLYRPEHQQLEADAPCSYEASAEEPTCCPLA